MMSENRNPYSFYLHGYALATFVGLLCIGVAMIPADMDANMLLLICGLFFSLLGALSPLAALLWMANMIPVNVPLGICLLLWMGIFPIGLIAAYILALRKRNKRVMPFWVLTCLDVAAVFVCCVALAATGEITQAVGFLFVKGIPGGLYSYLFLKRIREAEKGNCSSGNDREQ